MATVRSSTAFVRAGFLAAVCSISGAEHAFAQQLELYPTQGEAGAGIAPKPFLAACLNMGSWARTRRSVSYLGVADYALASYAESHPHEVATCFRNMNAAGLGLSLGTAALKQWCTTGQACFDGLSRAWNRLIALGANLEVLEIDEPLTMVLGLPDWPLARDFDYAVEHTAEFIRLVRQNYPRVRIVEQEAYPAMDTETLRSWIRALARACTARGARGPDYFEIDHDWNTRFGSGSYEWNWSDIRSMLNEAHGAQMGFGVVFWRAAPRYGETDEGWYNGVMDQGAWYAAEGIVPDLYSILSWLTVPERIVPDVMYGTSFMSTVRTFIATGRFPVLPAPFGRVPGPNESAGCRPKGCR
jgi:hypothetical protein